MPKIPDWAKSVLALVAATAGAVVVIFPNTVYAQIATVVVAVLAGLGITSGGVSSQPSDKAAAAHVQLDSLQHQTDMKAVK
jgi:hypothetical protein